MYKIVYNDINNEARSLHWSFFVITWVKSKGLITSGKNAYLVTPNTTYFSKIYKMQKWEDTGKTELALRHTYIFKWQIMGTFYPR